MASEAITIEVDEQTARAFEALPEQGKRKVADLLRLDIGAVANTGDEGRDCLLRVMDKIGRDAQAAGMMPEVLKEILGKGS